MVVENEKYIEKWLASIQERINEIKALAKKNNKKTFFSIGSTSQPFSDKPYITPIRILENGVISGTIVFSQTQAILVANLVSGQIDHVLLDSEKKIDIQVDVNHSILKHYNINYPIAISKARFSIEMGNISAAARPHLKDQNIIEYKPNDITVDAVWTYLSQKLGPLTGKSAAIIGCGNIGFKLALKLVECGINTEIVRRNSALGMQMANAINIIKPPTTLAKASYNSNPLQASLFSDILIGATQGTPVITWEMIQSMSPTGIIVDIGKGCINEDALEKAINQNIDIIRADISSALYGFVSNSQKMDKMIRFEIGRKEFSNGVSLISGGILGKWGDIIVDNYQSPTLVYGISDGKGNIIKEMNNEQQLLIKKLNIGQ